MSFRHHLRLLSNQLARGWVPTLAITLLVGMGTALLLRNGNYYVSEIAIAVLGIVATIAFLKAALMIALYRLLNNSSFEGSFFVMACLVSLFLILALGAVSFLAYGRITEFPMSELPMLFAVVYAIVTLFLFGLFRISNWIFGWRAGRPVNDLGSEK